MLDLQTLFTACKNLCARTASKYLFPCYTKIVQPHVYNELITEVSRYIFGTFSMHRMLKTIFTYFNVSRHTIAIT